MGITGDARNAEGELAILGVRVRDGHGLGPLVGGAQFALEAGRVLLQVQGELHGAAVRKLQRALPMAREAGRLLGREGAGQDREKESAEGHETLRYRGMAG